jgi:hypothetical protein
MALLGVVYGETDEVVDQIFNCVQIARAVGAESDQVEGLETILELSLATEQFEENGLTIHETGMEIDRPGVLVLGFGEGVLELQ